MSDRNLPLRLNAAIGNCFELIEEALPGEEALLKGFVKLEAERIVKNTLGTRFFSTSDSTLNFRWIIRHLKEKHINAGLEGDELRIAVSKDFFDAFKKLKEILTQTSHPTEVLSTKGIKAEYGMIELLSGNIELLTNPEFTAQNSELKDAIMRSIQIFAGRIERPQEKVSIKQELTESFLGVQKVYYSSDHIVASIFEAFMLEGLFTEPNEEFYRYFDGIKFVESHTWVGADNDSKPLTDDDIRDSIRNERIAMNRITIVDLARMAVQYTKAGNLAAANQSRIMMWRMLETIEQNYKNEDENAVRRKFQKFAEESREFGQDLEVIGEIEKIIQAREANKATVKNIVQCIKSINRETKEGHSLPPEDTQRSDLATSIYLNGLRLKGLIGRLNAVQTAVRFGENETVFFHKKSSKVTEGLNKLQEMKDSGQACRVINNISHNELELMRIRQRQFGNYAQRGEFRPNSGALNLAFKELCECLRETGMRVNEDDPAALLKIVHAGGAAANSIRALVRGKLDKLARLEVKYLAELAEKTGVDIEIGKRQKFYFGDLMIKLELLAKNPKAYPVILIAEGKGAKDVFCMQTLLEIMTNPEEKKKRPHYGSNKVVNLFEDSGPIINSHKEIEEMANNADYMDAVGNNITVMYAGSDSMKSSGSSIKEIIEQAYELGLKTLKEGQTLQVYLGTGSSHHRSSVVLSLYRTRQGIEMRLNGPRNIATEIERNFVREMADDLGVPYEMVMALGKASANDAVINLSNLLGFKELVSREHETEEAKERIGEYRNKTGSPTFTNLIKILPKAFEDLISFARRAAYRASYETDPAKDKPAEGAEGMRAIGYGMIFCHARWGALQLFHDCSGLLKGRPDGRIDEKTAAVQKYYKDPKLQDVVNRATYSMCLSDSDHALKYLNASFPQFNLVNTPGTKGEVIFNLSNNSGENLVINAEELFADYKNQYLGVYGNISDKMKAWMPEPDYTTPQRENACKAVIGVMVTYWEHKKTCRALYDLYSHMSGNTEVKADPKPQDILDLIQKINPLLGDELQRKRGYLDLSTDYILDKYKAYMSNPSKLNDFKKDKKLYLALAISKQIHESPIDVAKTPEIFSARYNMQDLGRDDELANAA